MRGRWDIVATLSQLVTGEPYASIDDELHQEKDFQVRAQTPLLISSVFSSHYDRIWTIELPIKVT